MSIAWSANKERDERNRAVITNCLTEQQEVTNKINRSRLQWKQRAVPHSSGIKVNELMTISTIFTGLWSFGLLNYFRNGDHLYRKFRYIWNILRRWIASRPLWYFGILRISESSCLVPPQYMSAWKLRRNFILTWFRYQRKVSVIEARVHPHQNLPFAK